MIITPLKDRVEETTWTIVALGSTSIFFSFCCFVIDLSARWLMGAPGSH